MKIILFFVYIVYLLISIHFFQCIFSFNFSTVYTSPLILKKTFNLIEQIKQIHRKNEGNMEVKRTQTIRYKEYWEIKEKKVEQWFLYDRHFKQTILINRGNEKKKNNNMERWIEKLRVKFKKVSCMMERFHTHTISLLIDFVIFLLVFLFFFALNSMNTKLFTCSPSQYWSFELSKKANANKKRKK